MIAIMFRRGVSHLRDIVSSALSQPKSVIGNNIFPPNEIFSRNLSISTVNFSTKNNSPLNITFPRNVLSTAVPFPRNIFTTGIFRFGENIDTLFCTVFKYSYFVDYVVVDGQYNYLHISEKSKDSTRNGSVYIEIDDIDQLLKGLNNMVQSSLKKDSISITSVARSNKTYRVVRSSFRAKRPTPKTVNYIMIEESKPNASEAPYSCTIYEEAWNPVIRNISTMAKRHSSKNKPHEDEPHAKVSPRNPYRNESEPHAIVSPRNTYRNEDSSLGRNVDTLMFSVLNKKYFFDYKEHRKFLRISEVSKGRKVSIWIEKDDVVELLGGLHYMMQDSPKEDSITIPSVTRSEKAYQVSRGSFGEGTKRNFIDIKECIPGVKEEGFKLTLNEPAWIPAIHNISTMVDRHIASLSVPFSDLLA